LQQKACPGLEVLTILTYFANTITMNKNLIYIGLAAYLLFLFSRKKIGNINSSSAANQAKKLVAEAVDQTTFLPDETTFADEYTKDKRQCR